MKTHLHFTFGPVQSFVAQARRTRDLYAGSFLLSRLALKAMQGAGGKIILPDCASLRKLADEKDLKHAIAPNRFIAEFDDPAAAAKAGSLAAEALKKEWKDIAEVVWTSFLDRVATRGPNTRDIWDRQIANFWEISWAVGDEMETDLLDRRKNWHPPTLSTEGGDHCTLMGDWQELSGFVRSKDRGKQDDFWTAVRAHVGNALDLEADERLCAIAFVKRFFPRTAKVAELDMQHWPSTVSIAAVPWLRHVKDKPDVHAAAKAYAELVGNEPGARVSSARRIAALENFPPAAGDCAELSGNYLNHTALENTCGTPLKDNDKNRRKLLVEKLRGLEKATDDHAGNFYALLFMDGDGMGALIRKHGAEAVTPCLTKFASKVPELIEDEKHSGICIYVGGDDLLAMLPLDHALDAVTAVRELYVRSFDLGDSKIAATISAGLVFAHYRCAFSRVLKYAHELLDDVAKDGAGRDAVALAVLKPGGVACQWVGKFEKFSRNGGHCFAPLIAAYRRNANGEDRGISSSFLYNLSERFAELFPLPEARDAHNDAGPDTSQDEPFDDDALQRLFVAEFLHGRLDKEPAKAEKQREQAGQLMRQLITVCYQPDARRSTKRRFDLDGARLIKFLALDGKEGAE
jgi:CRISPR-associated protein Cmr2